MSQEVPELNVLPIESSAAILPPLALMMLAGLALDIVLAMGLRRHAESCGWRATAQTARSLRGLPTFLALVLAIGFAVSRADLDPRTVTTIHRGLRIAAIVAVTTVSAILAGRLIRIYTQREGAQIPSSSIFVNLARVMIWVVGGLVILAALDVSITPLLTALGVGGLAIGLALQPTLENLFSGIQVLMSRQVEPGDFVRLETGEEGWVQDVTWRNTTIKMVSNDLVIVPNATVARSRIINFTSADEQHGVVVPLGVAYGSDLDHVERIVREVATYIQTHAEGAVRDHEPPVRFTEFADSSIHMIAVLRVEQYSERFAVRHEFLKRIHARFAEEDIEIPFPQRTVHLAGTDSATDDGRDDS